MLRWMDTPVRSIEKLKPQRNFRWAELRSPICAQCRSPMSVVLCEPDFHDFIVATYRCAECGLLDRTKINS